MERNGIVINGGTASVAHCGVISALSYIGYSDPYIMFTRGLSDVKIADDWHDSVYQIAKKLPNGKVIYITPDFDDCEAFQYDYAQGQWVHEQFLQRPYLDYYAAINNSARAVKVNGKMVWAQEPHSLHDIAISICNSIHDEMMNVGIEEMVGTEHGEYQELLDACSYMQPGGRIVQDFEMVEFCFFFAAWAAFVWAVSPRSMKWRCEANALFQVVHDEGEALSLGPTDIFGKSMFRKSPRPKDSCYRCEVESWCLENIPVDGVWRKICHSCDRNGLPVMEPANCGTKICRMPQCKHHPFFIFPTDRRLHETLRKDGLLTARTGQNPLLAQREAEKRLLQ